MTDSFKLTELMAITVRHQVAEANTVTRYREPLVGFAMADDPRFPGLRRVAEPSHLMPQESLPGARSIVAFLPFERQVLRANAKHMEES